MENFHKRYLSICRDHYVFPLEAVVRHVQGVVEGNETTAKILDLSSYNLTPDDCHALATTLTDDLYFEEVDFPDCLLSEESCKLLLLGLMENKSIKRLSLKGNNVRCGGAEVLGQFLKRNTCMESLQLEWNSLGLWDSGIVSLAEGLALNQIVRVLDLRNNQITHEGAGQIAAALRRNQSLRNLDLRWNNLGLLGGRELLGMLKYNKGLTSLELTGNNIPQDILRAVAVAVKQNSDRQIVCEEQRIKTDQLNKELEKVEELKMKEIKTLKEEMDRERADHDQLSRTTQEKIQQLRDALKERKTAFNSLAAKLSATDAELCLQQQKCQDFESLMSSLKTELHTEREKRMQGESQHSRAMDELLEKKRKLKTHASNLQHNKASLEEKVDFLETENEKINAEFVAKGKVSDEKFHVQLQESKNMLQKEINVLQHKSIENSELARLKIQQLEEERNQLEGAVSSLKSEAMCAKLGADEDLMNCKARLKQEELLRTKQYEERICMLQASRDDVQIQNTKQLSQLTELQTQNSCMIREGESLKRQVESLKQELEHRDREHRDEVTKLRSEVENGRKIQRELRDNISSFEVDILEIGRQHKAALNAKDSEVAILNEQLRSKENELRKAHEEELKRAELLEKAMYAYVSSTRSALQPSSPYKT